MTADTLAQVIYANLIEQRPTDLGRFQSLVRGTWIEGTVDLIALSTAILKAQNDAEAMRSVADPVSTEEFDKAVERSGLV